MFASFTVPNLSAFIIFKVLPWLICVVGLWSQYMDYLQSHFLNSNLHSIEEYDFIIVGAGSAGSLLANRLSENGNYTVLLLEAGGYPHYAQSVPSMFPAFLKSPEVDHGYHTVPQYNACLALNQQRSYWPRGRGIGGTSNLNAMIFQRGNKNDYDRWAELSGSEEWKFENILQNFKNIEDYHGKYKNDKWHSSDGNGVYVTIPSELKLTKELLQAGREMGYPTADVNGLQQASFSVADVNIKDGQRFAAYAAFIKPVLHRPNLEIRRYAQVIKVHLDKNSRAYKITYLHHGTKRFAEARKEVILSAGAVDTPKILMLSGIGPMRNLEKLGIKTLVDLPVGQNLQDHILVQVGPFSIKTPKSTANFHRDINLNEIVKYYTSGLGPMTSPAFFSGIAYIYSSLAIEKMKSENISKENVSPDIQLLSWPIKPTFQDVQEKQFNVKAGIVPEFHKSVIHVDDAFIINVMLAKYKSRGEIKLRSADPLDKPIINPRYFSHPDDIKVLVDGINFTVTMVENTRAFKKHKARLIEQHFPGCEKYTLRSLPYYDCFARHHTLTVYHPSATCTMGKGVGDPLAVVDSKLRVLNTKGLRVVDASIIPEIPNSNPNAAIYMIADKAAQMILDDYSKS